MDIFWKGGIRNSENEQKVMAVIQSDELLDDSDATVTVV